LDPSNAALAAVDRASLVQALEHLTPRQRAVIDGRFGLSGAPKTLSELGAELHLSAARVRAIEGDALYDLALELESGPGPP
jgi:DNA-directed RNA polymerase sigma subunit (sigma70/sigma32)